MRKSTQFLAKQRIVITRPAWVTRIDIAHKLEQLESLEQLRALYNGVGIHVAQACAEVPGGVDTQADLDAVCALVAAGE